jgi:hypothetical protein
MTALNRFATVLGFALVSVQAHAVQPVTFNFTTASASGSTYTAIDAATGLSVTASAWASATGTSATFAPAALSSAADGFGVCNSSETGCLPGNTLGALGNNAGSDMILFSFNAPVSLRALTIGQFVGTSSNLNMWAGTGSLAANTLPASLGTAASFNVAASNQVGNIVNVKISNTFKGNYDWIAVSAQLGAISDLAKLRALTVQINPQALPVPDAATWMTMLAGLGLVGFRVRRRTQG